MRMNATATVMFVLIGVFLGGLLAGVLVERTLLGPPVAEAAAAPASPRPGSAEDRERMARELDLTAEQQARIDEILDEQQAQLREIMRETRPRTRALLQETRSRIEEVLTPAQIERFEELHAQAHRGDRSSRDR
jgi:Spy/CpxP family protein refolding chaperone